MKLLNRLVALVAVAALSITAFTGCKKQDPIDNKEIVMTIGDKEVELGFANFVLRFYQSSEEANMAMYASYGYAMDWDMEIDEDGTTYEESLKKSILESIQQLYVLDAHAKEYQVEVTEDETAKIEEVANAFIEANKEETKEKVSAEVEYVKEYLRLITVSEKMHNAVKASHTPEIKEGEADQKIMYYVQFAKSSTDASGNAIQLTDDELAQLKKDAQAMLDGAKENDNLETYAKEKSATATKAAFSADSEDLDEALVKAADKLELNGFTEVIDTESAYYVAQVTSLFDQEATDAKEAELIEERKEEYYTETVDKWTEDTEIKVYDKVWKQITIEGLKVNAIKPEAEKDTTEGLTEGTTEVTE